MRTLRSAVTAALALVAAAGCAPTRTGDVSETPARSVADLARPVWGAELTHGRYGLTEAGHHWLADVIGVLREHERAYVEIAYRYPEKTEMSPVYAPMEGLHRAISRDADANGRIITRDAPDIPPEQAQVRVIERPEPVLRGEVPDGVLATARELLEAWSDRDQKKFTLFSERVRRSVKREDLEQMLCGVSNPHHAGYFIHEVREEAPGRWVATCSRFGHYTGYDLTLDLDPDRKSRFAVIREGGRFAVDSTFYGPPEREGE